VDDFLRVAYAVPTARWGEPRAPGKWSPRQIVEHLALDYEISAGVLRGGRSAVSAPWLLRPLVRWFLLRPILRRGRFPQGRRAPKALRPTSIPADPDQLLGRLATAIATFEANIAALRRRTVDHRGFGRIRLADFVRLQELHTRHHRAQLGSRRG
jgi:hypothetical protein